MKLLDALRTRNGARIIAGAGAFMLTLIVLVMMYIKPDLAENDLFKMIAQAIVIQGLIGLVMAWLFTSSPRSAESDAKDGEPL